MIIGSGNLSRDRLAGKTALVTGGGHGIGFEISRSLAWLGSKVFLTDMDWDVGKSAMQRIIREAGTGSAEFIHADPGNEFSLMRMAQQVRKARKQIQILIHTAVSANAGYLTDLDLKSWVMSYRVNLFAPAVLVRMFLPEMLSANEGAIICVAPVHIPSMGTYEIFKNAQVDFIHQLSQELENTQIAAFSVLPGIVPASDELAQLDQVAGSTGRSVNDLLTRSGHSVRTAEEVGAGISAAVVMAQQYKGRQIQVTEALEAAGISVPRHPLDAEMIAGGKTREIQQRASALCHVVRTALADQLAEWMNRTRTERQWLARDFGSKSGMPVERWLEKLSHLEQLLISGDLDEAARMKLPLERLGDYYDHLKSMTRKYDLDIDVVKENIEIIEDWKAKVNELSELIGNR
jgi:NAD(P)-dependent dehydrogenase (short-subunit alcohol dehydrogenase family)